MAEAKTEKDSNLVAKLDDLIKYCSDSRWKYERQWYVNGAFYENNHFVMWNKTSNSIDRVTPRAGSVLRSIGKARRQIDAMQNMVLSGEPRWGIVPDEQATDAEGTQISQRVDHWLQYKWTHLDVSDKLDQVVLNGLNYSVGYLFVGFDSFKQDIFIDVYDAFDIYIPPYLVDIQDAPFFIRTCRKLISDLKANPDYKNADKISVDNKMAQSELKETRMIEKFNEEAIKQEEAETVIFKEMWTKVKKNGETKMRVVTVAGNQVLLDKEYDISKYPLIPYSPCTGLLYQPSWIEKFIPANVSLDVFTSRLEEFMNLMVVGRMLKQKASTLSRVTNKNGEIIEYDTVPPTWLDIPTIPNFFFLQIQNLEKWIEEAGVSTAALGKAPKGVRAAKAIDSLKQSDYANLRVPVKNITRTLQLLTEAMIDVASTNYLVPQTIYRMEDEKPDYFSVIGEKGAGLMMNQTAMQGENPPVQIKKSYRVEATIQSGLSYTPEGKRDTMMQLFQAGLIPPQKVLESFQFSNISDLLSQNAATSNVSLTQTADFQILDPQLQQQVVQELMKPENMARNPIAQAEIINKQRKGARKSIKKA